MSLDAVVSRIDQILAVQQRLFDPAASAAATSAAASGSATGVPIDDASSASGQSFAGSLATAPTGAATAAAGASGYVNPLAGASVTAERMDQGVDYAGTGTIGAIGPGVVTQVVPSGSGWEGGGYVDQADGRALRRPLRLRR